MHTSIWQSLYYQPARGDSPGHLDWRHRLASAATLVAMLGLSWGKRVTSRQLGNAVLMTEAHVTLIDALLAAAVFVGLVANALLGWWLADPLAGLVIVYYAIKEGREEWRG